MFWTGETGRALKKLGPEAIVVSVYLVTSPHSNMLGVFYCPIAYIVQDTGLSFEGASKGLRWSIDAGFCSYDGASEVVWVHEMARYQIEASLKPGDKRVPAIAKEYAQLPKCSFLSDFFDKYQAAFRLENKRGIEAPSKPHRSQEQEQEQEQEHYTPPPPTRAGAREARDPFPMNPDWQPSEFFPTLAGTSGLVIPQQDELQKHRAEFVTYWLTQNRQRTAHEWDLAFIKAIKNGFGTPRPREPDRDRQKAKGKTGMATTKEEFDLKDYGESRPI